MNVELLNVTPLSILVKAIRTCWDSFDKGDNLGQKDLDLIDRVCNKYKHESVVEHIVFSFNIEGLSRLALQELVRHRIASLSVKSTRYTLKELRKECFEYDDEADLESTLKYAGKYVVLSGDDYLDQLSLESLKNLQYLMKNNPIDKVKYWLPESYKTNLVWTINARSLKNFLNLRLSKSAHYEIRELAKKILDLINDTEYKILFKDIKNEDN